MNTGHNGGGGGSYDGRGLTGAGKTSSMTSIPAPQNDTSKLSHSGSDSPGKTQNGRPISTFLGANVRPKRTISFSGISIGQNRLSFSPQAGQSYGRPQNPLSQLALSSGARQARSPTSITATSTTMSSSVPYKSKLSLSSTANNGGSYLRNNITRSVESTTAVTNNVNSNVSDDDDEDDYDSDYEEEKDAIILKLKAEAGRLENELQSLRRNIAVERSKIPGGGAVAIQATPPRMMTAGTQTDTLLVAKPTRPAPQPCTPPPPPPQSSPPPLPQSLPPSLDPQQIRAMEVKKKKKQ